MRNLTNIERSVPRQINFSYEDLTSAIFYSTPPAVALKPFFTVRDPYLKKTIINARLYIFEKEKNSLVTLAKSIEGDVKCNYDYLSSLPEWVIASLRKEYDKEVDNWIAYVTKHIEDFCEKNPDSLTYSGILDKGGLSHIFSFPLSFEQKLWISIQAKISKSEIVKFVASVRDSILPWLNIQLYKNMKDKEQNTRINEAFEEQRRKFLEGSIDSELDTVE
mgnify:CR=1 FL=1